MAEALGIEIPPLLDDPIPPNGFARWEPWPPQATRHLFMERFREFAHRPGPACRHPEHPASDARQTIVSRHPEIADLGALSSTYAIRINAGLQLPQSF
jgi:hypothetical protein